MKLFHEVKKVSFFGEQDLPSLGVRVRLYQKILESYHPRPLSSRGILFQSESQDEPRDEKYYRGVDYSLGWNNLFTRGLDIISVPGNHLSIMRQHNRPLAEKITQVLKQC